jgi:hypothetical protein
MRLLFALALVFLALLLVGFLLLVRPAWSATPDPSPEVCAKVREARKRFEHYLNMSSSLSKLELLAAKKKLLYAQMGYTVRTTEVLMADTYRALEEDRRRVQEAKSAHDRLADDLIGKVPEPWPAYEAPK